MQGWFAELISTGSLPPEHDWREWLPNVHDILLTLFAKEREIFPHAIIEGYDPTIESFYSHSGINTFVTNGEGSTHPESARKLISLHTEVLKHEGQES
jgi:hypothetical protein